MLKEAGRPQTMCENGLTSSGQRRLNTHLIKAVTKDGQGLVAQESDQGREMLQLLMCADADAQAPYCAHPVLRAQEHHAGYLSDIIKDSFERVASACAPVSDVRGC